MKVTLGTFASSCLEERFGEQAPLAAEAAVRQYADRVESQAPPVDVPPFLDGSLPTPGGTEIDLAVQPEVEATLRGEASRCEVPVERIVNHAVFILLSDLEPQPRGRTAIVVEEAATAPRYGGDARRFDDSLASCEGRPAQPRGVLVRSDRDRLGGGRDERHDDAG